MIGIYSARAFLAGSVDFRDAEGTFAGSVLSYVENSLTNHQPYLNRHTVWQYLTFSTIQPTHSSMNMSELNHLETAVKDLLSLAKIELEERRLAKQRDREIEQYTEEIRQRLIPLLKEIEDTLSTFESEGVSDSIAKQKLEEKAAEIRRNLEEAPLLAAQEIDRQLLLNEERLLDERMEEQTNRWRQALKADLLEMIREQRDFYSATDAAVTIRGYLSDLKAIGALDEVVEALIDQINAHSEEGPVARLRGSYEQTLTFIHNKALENRARVERPPDIQLRARHRTTEKRPNPYAQLEGKVVVFGGHDRLESSVRNRLRESNVSLYWCTAQAGLQFAEQTENHIANADLVLIVTGYASHSLTEKALRTAEKCGKACEMVNTTGMTRVLEAIEYGLKSKILANQFKSA